MGAIGRAALTIAVLVSAAAAATARAQGFDGPRYAALADECRAFIERAEGAQRAGDEGMTRVYLDLGEESCEQARAMLAGAVYGMTDAERAVLFEEAFSLEGRLVAVLVGLEQCEQARDLLTATSRLVDDLPATSVDGYAELAHATLRCLLVGTQPGDRVSLGPGSSGVTRSGTMRVAHAAADHVPDCPGFVPDEPSHVLDLVQDGLIGIEATSDVTDLVLLVTGGEGGWCDDDSAGGLDPLVRQWLVAGQYDVRVGSYGSAPTAVTYRASFYYLDDERPRAGPAYGEARLARSAPRVSLDGYTYGETSTAERFAVDCPGFVPNQPSHRLVLDEPASVAFTLTAPADTGLAMVIDGAGDLRCAPALAPLSDPVVEDLAAGTYDVYLAELSPWGTGYTLGFEATFSAAASAPLRATRVLAAGERVQLEGLTPLRGPGETQFSACGCDVELALEPDLLLEVADADDYAIMATSTTDVALEVRGPEALCYCNDDFAGSSPGIFRRLVPGVWSVFVGTAGWTESPQPWVMQIIRE